MIKTRTPGQKLLFAILIAGVLAIPLFTVYLLVYDREQQSQTAQSSIADGWGGPQAIAGPVLVLPYQDQVSEQVTEGGRQVVKTSTVWRELELAPEIADIRTDIKPERRRRSIYEAVVYEAHVAGRARFALPTDLARFGVTAERLAYDRAELRFGLRDARGLFGPPPSVSADGRRLVLQPGKGPSETNGSGFFTWLDARTVASRPLAVSFDYAFRGNGWLSLLPQAGDTRWSVTSPWPHPSFQGGFLPVRHAERQAGFTATWRIGNLALGRALVSAGEAKPATSASASSPYASGVSGGAEVAADAYEARVDLITPVDYYSQVNRSVKYG